MMKKLNCAIRGLILCFGMLMVLCTATKSQAAKYMEVGTSVKNKTTVEISWKKQSVTGYEIYRAKCNKSGDYKNYQKIATVSGKKTKYIDKTAKYNNWYSYKVKAYKKQGSKKKYKYEGYGYAYTAMQTPSLLYETPETPSDSIKFEGGIYGGIAPTAFEIYRKEGSSKYKKIKTIKVKSGDYDFEYTDKKVTKGKTYSYKIRTYKTIKGKKLYSKYSNVIKLTVAN